MNVADIPNTQAMNTHNRWMTALTVLLGSMAMGLSATMPVVALPAMMEAFEVGQTRIQWLMTGFQIMATTPVLATGWLSARFGLRRSYVFTLLLFIVSSLLGALASHIWLAIVARIVQGIAMGLIPALALIAIARAFPANALGLAMGVFGIGAVLTPAVGPYLTGVVLEPWGWQSIFLLPLLLCLPTLVLAFKYVPGLEPDAPHKRFDWWGMALATVFMFALLNVTGFGLEDGWGSWQALGCLGLAAFTLVAFVIWQLRAESPLLELALFRSGPFRAVLGVAVLYGFCLYGASYLIPYFLQSAAGYSPEDSGAMQIPGGMALVAVIFIAGIGCDRLGARTVIQAGLGVFAASFLCFTFISDGTGFWMAALWFALNRVGMGMLIPSTSMAAIQSVAPVLLPWATATLTFFLGLGGSVGINVFSILYQWRLEAAPGPKAAFGAFQMCFWLALGVLMVALVLAVWVGRTDGGRYVPVERASA